MASERIKRPDLDRAEPIRGFGGLFGRTPTGPREGGRAAATGSVGEVPAAREAPEADANGAARERTPAARAVAIGYEIMDEYLRQGRALAQGISSTGSASETRSAPDALRLTERMVQAAFDFTATWLEYYQTAFAPTPPAPSSRASGAGAGAGPFDMPEASRPSSSDVRACDAPENLRAPAAAAHSAAGAAYVPPDPAQPAHGVRSRPESTARDRHSPPRVSIQILSKRRAQVSVDVKPAAASLALFAHDLRARDLSLPRIAGIRVEADARENAVVVGIDVPDDQPAGTYSGIIVDDRSNLPQGTITVRVLDG